MLSSTVPPNRAALRQTQASLDLDAWMIIDWNGTKKTGMGRRIKHNQMPLLLQFRCLGSASYGTELALP